MEDRRLFAPAAARNRDVIAEVLMAAAPSTGVALEIASGTGEHVVHLAGLMPGISWQPTDIDPDHLASINAHRIAEARRNILPAMKLDVLESAWPVDQVDLIFNANMVHISPWACCEGLMAGAGRHLASGGLLFMYGPYRRDGAHTADSNRSFDQSLKSRNLDWGVRDLEDVVSLADSNGLVLERVVTMPANNLSVIYRRS